MERKLVYTDAIFLLEQLIATPSVSKSEDKTADIICSFLQGQGIIVHRVFNNVWAQCQGFDDSKPTVLLNTHHDTVKPSSAYSNDPFKPFHQNGALFGLGSNDAGASLVCMIILFCNHWKDELPYNLMLDISAEEEVMGEHGIRAIIPEFARLGKKIDMALVGEPTGMNAAVGEHGLIVLDCVAHGRQGHAARYEGDNAIYKAICDIELLKDFKFKRRSSILGDIKITTTQIEAGIQHNIVPDSCHFVVDIRPTDVYSNEEIVEILQQKLISEVHPRSTRIHASVINQSHPLVQAALKLGRSTYISPTTSDMALMPYISMKMGIGQSCRSHSANEYVLESEIEEGLVLYDKYIQLLAEELKDK